MQNCVNHCNYIYVIMYEHSTILQKTLWYYTVYTHTRTTAMCGLKIHVPHKLHSPRIRLLRLSLGVSHSLLYLLVLCLCFCHQCSQGHTYTWGGRTTPTQTPKIMHPLNMYIVYCTYSNMFMYYKFNLCTINSPYSGTDI